MRTLKDCGLSSDEIECLITLCRSYPDIKQIKLFGSRAKGNFTARSDIDLAIIGNKVTRHTINNLLLDLDDSDIPYSVDAINYQEIKNASLINHIDRIGITLYSNEVAD